jgi:hypothetical protein
MTAVAMVPLARLVSSDLSNGDVAVRGLSQAAAVSGFGQWRRGTKALLASPTLGEEDENMRRVSRVTATAQLASLTLGEEDMIPRRVSRRVSRVVAAAQLASDTWQGDYDRAEIEFGGNNKSTYIADTRINSPACLLETWHVSRDCARQR